MDFDNYEILNILKGKVGEPHEAKNTGRERVFV
ncbi:hypothetical protein CCACVL1_25825 [Corchorus capsularis]|uniref:Uncharacterized protein n=1 Tax=Corchorus capsularis TaxID=210143 RepID=A0A1R3GH00_COCAP|nr:hypothetical protein CCACVL1_25825 [Corchorus capsularis]